MFHFNCLYYFVTVADLKLREDKSGTPSGEVSLCAINIWAVRMHIRNSHRQTRACNKRITRVFDETLHYCCILNNKVLIYAISMSTIEYDLSMGQKKFMSVSSQISWWEETRRNRDQLFQITYSA